MGTHGPGPGADVAVAPGYHYSTEEGESRIRGGTTPTPVSYLVAHKRPAAAMSWRPQGKNYVQENSAKSRGYTMYLYESADVVSQAPGAQPGG